MEQETSGAPSHLGAAQGARVHREDGQVRCIVMMLMVMMMVMTMMSMMVTMMVTIYKMIIMESIVYTRVHQTSNNQEDG